MLFDEPMAKAHVLEIRKFAEDLELLQREALLDQARRWVTGEK